MPATALIRKPVQSKGVDLALCKRSCRRASAAESWATLVFGRLNWEQISLDLAMELAELAEKDAAELRQLTAALAPDVNSEAKIGSAVANAEQDKGKSNQSPALAYEMAAKECSQQAEKKSIGFVLALFTQW